MATQKCNFAFKYKVLFFLIAYLEEFQPAKNTNLLGLVLSEI